MLALAQPWLKQLWQASRLLTVAYSKLIDAFAWVIELQGSSKRDDDLFPHTGFSKQTSAKEKSNSENKEKRLDGVLAAARISACLVMGTLIGPSFDANVSLIHYLARKL